MAGESFLEYLSRGTGISTKELKRELKKNSNSNSEAFVSLYSEKIIGLKMMDEEINFYSIKEISVNGLVYAEKREDGEKVKLFDLLEDKVVEYPNSISSS